jgi:hypothetical protein
VVNTPYGAAAEYIAAPGGYPVSVDFPGVEYRNKIYAFPIVGMLLKGIMLIPFYIVLTILSYVLWLVMLVTWIPVLFTGVYPSFAYSFYGGMTRWSLRMYSFLAGLQDKYPSFSFSDEPGNGNVTMSFADNRNPSKLYAVPILGCAIKMVILIPHFIVLGVLGFVSSLLVLVTWIPVLATGQYPAWGLSVIGGTLRWTGRVMAFMYGITDVYPPFSLQ